MTRSASLLTLVSLTLAGCDEGPNGALESTSTDSSARQSSGDGTRTDNTESAALVRTSDESTAATTEEASDAVGPSIVSFSFRTHTVHLHAKERYTVEDASGHVLARGLSKAAFAEQFPDVYAEFEGVMNTNQGRDEVRQRERRFLQRQRIERRRTERP